jgi:hypothetical protein
MKASLPLSYLYIYVHTYPRDHLPPRSARRLLTTFALCGGSHPHVANSRSSPAITRMCYRCLKSPKTNHDSTQQTPAVTSNNQKSSSSDKRQNQLHTWPSTCLLLEVDRQCKRRRYLPDWEGTARNPPRKNQPQSYYLCSGQNEAAGRASVLLNAREEYRAMSE